MFIQAKLEIEEYIRKNKVNLKSETINEIAEFVSEYQDKEQRQQEIIILVKFATEEERREEEYLKSEEELRREWRPNTVFCITYVDLDHRRWDDDFVFDNYSKAKDYLFSKGFVDNNRIFKRGKYNWCNGLTAYISPKYEWRD